MAFDMSKFVFVNKQNRPTTVYDRNKRQVRVAPISNIQPYQPWDKNGIYVLTDPFYAQYVGPQGPLYTMARKEAEKLLGDDFPVDGESKALAPDSNATPVGESVTTQAARAASAPTPPAPAPVTPPDDQNSEDDETTDPQTEAPAGGEGDDEVELMTEAELSDMPFKELQVYAANWDLKGNSRASLMEKLHAGDFVAPADVA
jgi:hypothetical protein